MVTQLRAAYEDWWTKVTERADEKIPIEIGGDRIPQTLLNSHDWHNVEEPLCVWNQCQVRQGIEYNGYWEVEVLRAGTYTFDLCRWPCEADLGLTDGIYGPSQVDFGEMTYEVRHGGGRSLPIATAELEVGSQRQMQTVVERQRSATFTVQLDQGSTDLRTRFYNDRGLNLGAYYVYVRLERP